MDIAPGNRLGLQLGYRRNARTGGGTTTLELEGDNFPLNREYDDENTELTAALRLTLPRLTLTVEEAQRTFRDAGSTVLEDSSTGIDSLNATMLELYLLETPTETTGWRHSLRVMSRATRRLQVSGVFSLENLDVDYYSANTVLGRNTSGGILASNLARQGKHNRDILSGRANAIYQLNDRLTFLASVRYAQFDQTGQSDTLSLSWRYQNTGGKAGFQLLTSPRTTFAAGLNFDQREIDAAGSVTEDFPRSAGNLQTNTGWGYYSDLDWRPNQRASMGLQFQQGRYDQPFAATSPAGYLRLRARGRWRGLERWSVGGDYRWQRTTHNSSDWRSSQQQLNLSIDYRRKVLEATLVAGYSSVENRVTTLLTSPLPNGTYLPPYPQLQHLAQYNSNALMLTARLRWNVTKAISLGSNALVYESVGSADTWPLTRYDLAVYTDFVLMQNYVLKVSYRYLRYEEKLLHLNDYTARLAQISVGYRW